MRLFARSLEYPYSGIQFRNDPHSLIELLSKLHVALTEKNIWSEQKYEKKAKVRRIRIAHSRCPRTYEHPNL